MTLTQFSPGVNTSFSSELNANFTEVSTNLAKSYRHNPIRQTLSYTNSATYVNGIYLGDLHDPATTTIVAKGVSDNIYKSTDGGANWTLKNSYVGVSALVASVENSNYIVAYGSASAKYTTDGGENWTSISAMPGSFTFSVAAITNSGRVYVMGTATGTAYIKVYYTDTSGSSWTDIRTGTINWTGFLPSVSFSVGHDGYICYAGANTVNDDAEIAYTVNNGSAWTVTTEASDQKSVPPHSKATFYDTDNFSLLAGYHDTSNNYYNIGTAKVNGTAYTTELYDQETTTGTKEVMYLFFVNGASLLSTLDRNSVPQFSNSTVYNVDDVLINNVMLSQVGGQSIYEVPVCYNTNTGKPVFGSYTVYDPFGAF